MTARPAVEEQQETRRKQLMRATLQEVSEKGFSAVTLDDIAARAGVSKGVALYYFKSKEELFVAAFQRLLSILWERRKAILQQPGNALEKLRALMDTIFVSVKENRDFYRTYLDILSLGTRHEVFRQLNERFFENCVRVMDPQILEEGARQGLFRPDADPAVIRALFDGMMLQWLFDDPSTFEDYRRRYQEALMRYLQA